MALVVRRDVHVDVMHLGDKAVDDRLRMPLHSTHSESRVRAVEKLRGWNSDSGTVDEVYVPAAPPLGQAAVEVETPESWLLVRRRLVGRRRRQLPKKAFDRDCFIERRGQKRGRAVFLAYSEEITVAPWHSCATIGNVR